MTDVPFGIDAVIAAAIVLATYRLILLYVNDDSGATNMDEVMIEVWLPWGEYDSIEEVPSVQAAEELANRESDDGE